MLVKVSCVKSRVSNSSDGVGIGQCSFSCERTVVTMMEIAKMTKSTSFVAFCRRGCVTTDLAVVVAVVALVFVLILSLHLSPSSRVPFVAGVSSRDVSGGEQAKISRMKPMIAGRTLLMQDGGHIAGNLRCWRRWHRIHLKDGSAQECAAVPRSSLQGAGEPALQAAEVALAERS